MAAVVWFTMGVAIWHFSVFVPDRFRWGIVGAFVGSVIGAMLTGAAYQLSSGDTIGNTDLVTAFAAVPGTLLGMAAMYALGVRDERRYAH
jgi:hypothetical protein